MGRKPNGQFQAGVSGNPGGRPAQLAEVTELARARTPKVIETLYGIVIDDKHPTSARVSAAQTLLDRGYVFPIERGRVGDRFDVDPAGDQKQFGRRNAADLVKMVDDRLSVADFHRRPANGEPVECQVPVFLDFHRLVGT